MAVRIFTLSTSAANGVTNAARQWGIVPTGKMGAEDLPMAAGLFVSKGALAFSAFRARCSAFASATDAVANVRVACV